MTIWTRLIAPFRKSAGARPPVQETGEQLRRGVLPAQQATPMPRMETPPVLQQADASRTPVGSKLSTSAGQTVRAQRAGYMPDEDAKQRITATPRGTTPLRLVTSKYGFDLAFSDGKLVDHQLLALRQLNIFAFRIRGTSYYDDPRLQPGQKLLILREQDNPHDPNAILLTTPNGLKIGYVNKQRAKWVARLIDEGTRLQGIILQAGPYVPIALLAPADVLASLQGREPAG